MPQKDIDLLQNGDIVLRLTQDDIKKIRAGVTKLWRIICCDCELEHLWLFDLDKKTGNIVARVYRDDAATSRMRKKTKKKK